MNNLFISWKEFQLIKEADEATPDTSAPAPTTGPAKSVSVFEDEPRTVVMNNLNRLAKMIRQWFSNQEMNPYVLFQDERSDVEVSSARGIRDPYLKFSVLKGQLLFDIYLRCPLIMARKGEGLNSVAGYYGNITLFDGADMDDGNDKTPERSTYLSKKVIDGILPEDILPKWLKKQFDEMLEDINIKDSGDEPDYMFGVKTKKDNKKEQNEDIF